MKKYWQLFWHMRRIHLMRLFEYRANFFFWSFVDVMWTAFNFLFFSLLVDVTGNLAGWSKDQMFILLGVFTIVDAFVWSFFHSNMKKFTADIYNGDFNMVLTKPVDAQFWLMTRENDYTNILRVILGTVIIARSLIRLQLHPSLLQILAFVCLLIASLTLIYFLWFLMSTIAFYVERLENINEIIPNIERIYQVPHQIYTGIVSVIFTTLVPLGLISSVPSQALLGNGSWFTSLYLMVFALILVIVSRLFFTFSVKRYAGIAG